MRYFTSSKATKHRYKLLNIMKNLITYLLNLDFKYGRFVLKSHTNTVYIHGHSSTESKSKHISMVKFFKKDLQRGEFKIA